MPFKLLLLGIIVHLTTQGIDGQSTNTCYNGVIVGGECYFVSDTQATKAEAAAMCQASGGELASIQSAGTQEAVVEFLKSMIVKINVWISLTEETPRTMWYWELDGSMPAAQGCFADDSGDRDLPTEVLLFGMNPEICIRACAEGNFAYAGVQNGYQCFCGNSYNASNEAGPCVTPCVSAANSTLSKWCGGPGMNFIFSTTGIMHGSWGYHQPNYHENYQDCAAIDVSIEYKYGDETCGRELRYICHITSGPVFTTCSAESYMKIEDDCLYMGKEPVDWYTARRTCKLLGGHIVKIADETMHSHVKRVIQMSGQAQKYWIGLTRLSGDGWDWPDGSPFEFSSWADGEPSKRSEKCVVLSGRDDYMWDDFDCDTEASFMCTGENLAPTTTTTTTTSTTTTTPTTTSTTTSTTTPTTTPTTTLTTTPTTTTTTTPTTTPTTPPPTSKSSSTTASTTANTTTTPKLPATARTSKSTTDSSTSTAVSSISTAVPGSATSTKAQTSSMPSTKSGAPSTTVSSTNTTGISNTTGVEGTSAAPDTNGTTSEPGAGQQIENTTSGLSWVEILLICLACLLALIVLIVLLCIFCAMKNNKNRKVGYKYDARPKAPVPVSDLITTSNITFDSLKSGSVGSRSTDTLRENKYY